MLKEYQKTIIELLGQLELEIANLYKLFSIKFPKYKDMWIKMSKMEITHANKLKELDALSKNNRVVFDEKLTKTYTVKTVIEIVKDLHARADANKLTLMEALSHSRDLEESIIEKHFYDYFAGRDPDAKIFIHDIKDETHEHQSELKNIWEKERNRIEKKFDHIYWEPKFTVHVEELNTQHRKLFDITNQIIDIYNTHDSDFDKCNKVIEDLFEYSSAHFHAEQMIMMKSGYPACQQHFHAHYEFLDKLGDFIQSYKQQEENLSLNIVTFLSDWLYTHTTSIDLAYGKYLLKSGYLKQTQASGEK